MSEGPSLAVAKEFLDFLLGPNAQTCFQAIDTRREESLQEDEKKKRPWHEHGSLEQLFPKLARVNTEGMSIYFAQNQTDGTGRQKKNIIAIRSLCVDLDGSPLDPVLDCPIHPHIITCTSKGRYQCFWRVNDCKLDQFIPITLALARAFDGDQNIATLERVLRLPGFFNTKRDY